MDLRTALRSTGSARSFTDEPMSDATVAAILDDARFAPSGGNRQGWRVALVKDRALRLALGEAMQPVWDAYVGEAATGVTPFAAASAARYEFAPSRVGVPNDLIANIETVPAVLVVALNLGLVSMMDGELERPPVTGGASIYPFCWSIVLAARARGYGGVLTTFLSRAEPVVAPSLGLPADHALAATIFLGRPTKQITRLRRREVAEFATIDCFDGVALKVES
jgi:nitroreductase